MNNTSRKSKSLKNVIIGFINKTVLLVFAFAMRTVFIRLLGAEYVGISGLFTNILSLLSIANLGFDGALNYMLYQAIYTGRDSEIAGVVYYFRRFCIRVAVLILAIGFIVSIFLPIIVKTELDMFHVYLYYFLYLFDSVASYFVVYRTKVIIADQKQYIQDICVSVSTIIMYLFQTIYLWVFRDFTGFLVIQVCGTLFKNILLDLIARQMYPFISSKPKAISYSSYDVQFKRHIEGTILVSIGNILVQYSDNIIISMLLGTTIVGFYSNYKLLTSYIATVIYILKTGIIASVGNYYAEKGGTESEELCRKIYRIYALISAFCSGCFFACVQDFVPIWIGEKFLLDDITVLAIIILFYVDLCIEPTNIMVNATGIFKEVRYSTILCAIVNVILSICLGCSYGLLGIVIGTIIAKLSTILWIVPYELYKNVFRKTSLYFIKEVLIGIIELVGAMVLAKLTVFSIVGSVLGLMIRVLVIAVYILTIILIYGICNGGFKRLFLI